MRVQSPSPAPEQPQVLQPSMVLKSSPAAYTLELRAHGVTVRAAAAGVAAIPRREGRARRVQLSLVRTERGTDQLLALHTLLRALANDAGWVAEPLVQRVAFSTLLAGNGRLRGATAGNREREREGPTHQFGTQW
jgi:hypothetical protein